MTHQQKTKLKALKNSLAYFSRTCLKIKTKEATIAALVFNQSQDYFHAKCQEQLRKHGKVRLIVVKGRQSGISTYVAARFYHKTSLNDATNTFILSHEANTTQKLFGIVKMYHERNPFAPEAARSNARELDFKGIDSTYYVGTAGSGDVGRGGTVRLFHGSEVAMWKNTDEIQTGLMESIPNLRGTEVILESTAKGMGNFFHRMTVDALAGKNEYEVVFIPWFWMDEYEEDASRFEPTHEELEYAGIYLDYDEATQMRKLAWRRLKIGSFGSEWKFKQEYPSNVQEAFQTSGDSLINAEDLMRARHSDMRDDMESPLVIGVDPARSGDRTALIFRRGRKITRVVTYDEMTEMRLAGIVAGFIDDYKPAAVNIDCTNSWGSHDRLVEMGYGKVVNGIHFASKAIEDRLYRNKRAEMWCNLRDWLKGDVCVPDDDELQVDFMCVPDYKETSDGLIQLVSKDKIRQASGLSPDLGDAAALTFAVRVNVAYRAVQKQKDAGLTSSKRRAGMKKKR